MASRTGQAVLVVLGVFGAYWAADAMRHPTPAYSIGEPEGEREAERSRWIGASSFRRTSIDAVSSRTVQTPLLQQRAGALAVQPVPVSQQPIGSAVASATVTASAAPPTPANFGFKAPSRAPLGGPDMKSLAVGDVTGDGRDDIVVTVSSEDGAGRSAVLFKQTTTGTLGAPRDLDASGGSYNPGLVLGDINGDGIRDIVVGHRSGLTTFSSADDFAAVRTNGTVDGQYLAMIDINRDGRRDVFAQSWSFGGGVYLGDGQGGMRHAQAVDTGAWGSNSLRTGDLTGDGIADILLASPQGEQLGFWVYPGQRSGGLGAPVFHELTSFPVDGPEAATIGDFNGDGRADVVLAHGWTIPDALLAVKFQKADGTLGPEMVIRVDDSPDALVTADIDGNGLDDIVVSHGDSEAVGYLLQSDQGFGPEILIDLPMTQWGIPRSDGLAVGDVNSDGCPDIVVASGTNDLTILYGKNCLPQSPPMSTPLPALLAE